MTNEPEILFDSLDGIGFVRLNRPKTLNALTRDMCLRLDERLEAWGQDGAIKAVIIEGTGERAFCAGGDIRSLYDQGKAGAPAARGFFADEYRMNSRIHHFPKPYIALIDGIVMGGGVGVSGHGSHRVASERTLFAMPETGIGMIPDVGGSYLLSRLPGRIGLYLGLTGARLKAACTQAVGVATHYIPEAKHGELKRALAAAEIRNDADVDAILARFDEDPGVAPIAALREEIDIAFAPETVEGILDALQGLGSDWALATRETLLSKSPTSLKVTNRQIREGATLSFNDCMRMEYRIVWHLMDGDDFYEGVRAVLVDKDNAPKWQPDSLAGVSGAEVDKYFASLGEHDLKL